MNKQIIKDFFHLKKLSTRELCTLGLLLAITVIMAMFFTIRVGSGIKIPTKFLPIAISAMLFGPLWGGIIGILADLLAYMFNPVAGFLPQITFIEFLYGFTYGLMLKNITRSPKGYLKGIFVVLFQIVFLHLLLTSYFLIPIMGNNFGWVVIYRLPAAAINTLLQVSGICFIITYSNTFRKFSGGVKL